MGIEYRKAEWITRVHNFAHPKHHFIFIDVLQLLY